jgi:hypothetical protein
LRRRLLPVHRDGRCQKQVLGVVLKLHSQTFVLSQAIWLGQIRELFLETRVPILGISILRLSSVRSDQTSVKSQTRAGERFPAEEGLRVPELEQSERGQLAPVMARGRPSPHHALVQIIICIGT